MMLESPLVVGCTIGGNLLLLIIKEIGVLYFVPKYAFSHRYLFSLFYSSSVLALISHFLL